MKNTLFVLSFAFAMVGVASAQTFLGTTTGGPTWTRPVQGNPPTGISGVGVGVRYQTITFTVDVAGSYDFQNTAIGGWDNFTFLYQTAFDPTNQLTNVLIGNDDNPTIGLSGFSRNLALGTDYVFVTTGFAPGDSGAYELKVSNLVGGVATVVPEPASMAAMGLGLAALARKRKKA